MYARVTRHKPINNFADARKSGRFSRHCRMPAEQRPHDGTDRRQIAVFFQGGYAVLIADEPLGFEVPEEGRTEICRPLDVGLTGGRAITQPVDGCCPVKGIPYRAKASGFEQQKKLRPRGLLWLPCRARKADSWCARPRRMVRPPVPAASLSFCMRESSNLRLRRQALRLDGQIRPIRPPFSPSHPAEFDVDVDIEVSDWRSVRATACGRHLAGVRKCDPCQT